MRNVITINFKWLRLGTAIRAGRQAQGLSQEALAELVSIDRSYKGSIERGENNLAIMNLIKIADALELRASLPFDEDGN